MDAFNPTPANRRNRMPEVVKSAVRALEILDFFDHVQQPVSVGTIATALHFPQSSTSALIRSLVKVGYLKHDARTRTFLPTRRVAMLGSWMDGPYFRDGPVLEAVQRLNKSTGLAVGIGRRNNWKVQWLHACPSADLAASDIFRHGATLTRSAVGLSLLTPLNDNKAQGLVRRVNSEMGDLDAVVSWPSIARTIAEVRRDGYAFLHTEGMDMLSMLAPVGLTGEPTALVLCDRGEALRSNLPAIVASMREIMAELTGGAQSSAIALRAPDRESKWLMERPSLPAARVAQR